MKSAPRTRAKVRRSQRKKPLIAWLKPTRHLRTLPGNFAQQNYPEPSRRVSSRLCYNRDMAKIGKQSKTQLTSFAVEFDREDDGRWIAEIPKLPGVMAYGLTKKEALRKVYAITLRTLADGIEQGKAPMPITRLFDYEVAR